MQLDISVSALLEQINDGIYFVDRNRVITYWNKAAEMITGFSASEVIGRSCSDNILNHVDGDGLQLCLHGCPLEKSISDTKNRETKVYLHHKEGHRIPVLVRTSPYVDEEGECLGGIELFTDISNISSEKERIEELEKLAMIDSLTEVANRYYISQQLESSFEELKRYQMPFGILFFDIDHFKIFNDTYGHDIGDKVLKLVSRTVQRNLRPFDLFGRWGGEEFIGIIRNVNDDELKQVAERFRVLIEKSFIHHEGNQLEVTVSVGATMGRVDDTPATIQKRADSLMYQSKDTGRNVVTIG